MRSIGFILDGQDVFHIIANARGGASHHLNYWQCQGSTFNRLLGCAPRASMSHYAQAHLDIG